MPHLVKIFYNNDNTAYHKGREKFILHEIPVLFNFVTFALPLIQWSASRTEGRIIGFGVSPLTSGNMDSCSIG